MRLSSRRRRVAAPGSAFAGFRFPAEVILVAVRWYLRYGLSYRDVEEWLVERGVEVERRSYRKCEESRRNHGVDRFKSRDAHARDNGTAPVLVWYSNKARHRPIGSRQLNTALYRIAMTQPHWQPPAKVMAARRWQPNGPRLRSTRRSRPALAVLARASPKTRRMAVVDTTPFRIGPGARFADGVFVGVDRDPRGLGAVDASGTWALAWPGLLPDVDRDAVTRRG